MMNSLARMATLGSVLALSLVVGAVTLSAQATDPRVGTWKLNVAKSTFSPGPAPQTLTVNVEPSGQGEKTSTNGMAADGTPTMTSYTANFDGKDQPLKGSSIADTVSLKRIDARTTERTDKKDGKTVQTLNRLVSQDGKTMSVTVIGTTAQGQPVNSVLLFEKQ